MDTKRYLYFALIIIAVGIILTTLQQALAGTNQLGLVASMIFGLFLVVIVLVRVHRYMPPTS